MGQPIQAYLVVDGMNTPMHWKLRLLLASSAAVSMTPCLRIAPSKRMPTVASVTSVRCFPLFAQFSPGSPGVQKKPLRHQPNPPFRSLRDLRAMLSPIRQFSPGSSGVQKSPSATNPIPRFRSLRDLRDLRAMFSPIRAVLARKPRCPKEAPPPPTQSPVSIPP
jgi:hypothetical protein